MFTITDPSKTKPLFYISVMIQSVAITNSHATEYVYYQQPDIMTEKAFENINVISKWSCTNIQFEKKKIKETGIVMAAGPQFLYCFSFEK